MILFFLRTFFEQNYFALIINDASRFNKEILMGQGKGGLWRQKIDINIVFFTFLLL